MGGQAEQINTALESRYQENMTLADALTMAVDLLGRDPAAASTAPSRPPSSRWRSSTGRAPGASSAASPARC